MDHLEYSIRQVKEEYDLSRDGFIKVYQEAFAGPPYFETFSDEEVIDVWNKHIPHCLMVAEYKGLVVGLSCCTPLLCDAQPSVKQFLMSQQSLPFDPAQTIYMSEVAVLSEHRKQGLGRKLIEARLEWGDVHGFRFYIMRTADRGSNSARLYCRMGAQKADFEQNVEHEGVETASTVRMYLYGNTDQMQIVSGKDIELVR